MGKLLPILLVLLGLGGGVGAGMFLRPPPEEAECAEDADCEAEDAHKGPIAKDELKDNEDTAFAVFKKQFVIPMLTDGKVTGLVVVSVAIAVDSGHVEAAFALEPRLRDAFLRVLFVHASSGGFNGNFLNERKIDDLKGRLNEVADPIVGDSFQEVLLTEVVRQDF
ncbi:flagellar basal body-associated FliL family protein [Halovulum sp. GXIMD14793]